MVVVVEAIDNDDDNVVLYQVYLMIHNFPPAYLVERVIPQLCWYFIAMPCTLQRTPLHPGSTWPGILSM